MSDIQNTSMNVDDPPESTSAPDPPPQTSVATGSVSGTTPTPAPAIQDTSAVALADAREAAMQQILSNVDIKALIEAQVAAEVATRTQHLQAPSLPTAPAVQARSTGTTRPTPRPVNRKPSTSQTKADVR